MVESDDACLVERPLDHIYYPKIPYITTWGALYMVANGFDDPTGCFTLNVKNNFLISQVRKSHWSLSWWQNFTDVWTFWNYNLNWAGVVMSFQMGSASNFYKFIENVKNTVIQIWNISLNSVNALISILFWLQCSFLTGNTMIY